MPRGIATIEAQSAFTPSESTCLPTRPESRESKWSWPFSPARWESWRPRGLLSCVALSGQCQLQTRGRRLAMQTARLAIWVSGLALSPELDASTPTGSAICPGRRRARQGSWSVPKRSARSGALSGSRPAGSGLSASRASLALQPADIPSTSPCSMNARLLALATGLKRGLMLVWRRAADRWARPAARSIEPQEGGGLLFREPARARAGF